MAILLVIVFAGVAVRHYNDPAVRAEAERNRIKEARAACTYNAVNELHLIVSQGSGSPSLIIGFWAMCYARIALKRY
jgi:hypothetical protein